ncbi:MAG: tol-pal system-associated acyl-CoA thioesterase [Roseibium sp.]|nr:tol-pal system-associated acyl-CoA thioesterase [Roseibium sp.]
MTQWPDLAGRIQDGLHVLPVRVYYEDTDFTGIVYHGAFVRFFERGRSDMLRLAGIHHADLRDAGESGLAFAVRGMDLEFLKPATIDDVLTVHTRLVDHRGARIELAQEIRRGEEPIARAQVRVAVITMRGRPTRLPKALEARLQRLSV